MCSTRPQGLDYREQMRERPCQTVDPRHHQDVATLDPS
jgi:hypothetical protein